MVPTVTPSTPSTPTPMPMARCAAAWRRLSAGVAGLADAGAPVSARRSGILIDTCVGSDGDVERFGPGCLAGGFGFEGVMPGIDRDGRPEYRAVDRTSVANDLDRCGLCGRCRDREVRELGHQSLRSIARQLLAIARACGMRRGHRSPKLGPRTGEAPALLVAVGEVQGGANPRIQPLAGRELRARGGVVADVHEPAAVGKERLGGGLGRGVLRSRCR